MGRKGTRVPGMGAACLHLTGMWTGGAGLFSPEAAAWGAAAWAGGMGVGLGGGAAPRSGWGSCFWGGQRGDTALPPTTQGFLPEPGVKSGFPQS